LHTLRARPGAESSKSLFFGPRGVPYVTEGPKNGRFAHISLYIEFSIPYDRFDLSAPGFRTEDDEPAFWREEGPVKGVQFNSGGLEQVYG
jgi:hypothetical protein